MLDEIALTWEFLVKPVRYADGKLTYFLYVHQHARGYVLVWWVTLNGLLYYNPWKRVAICFGHRYDLFHRGNKQIVNGPRCPLHLARRQTRQGTNWVERGIVDQLNPTIITHVRFVGTVCFQPRTVDFGEVLSCLLLLFVRYEAVFKRPNIQDVLLSLFYNTGGDLMSIYATNTGQYDIRWESAEEGFLDI